MVRHKRHKITLKSLVLLGILLPVLVVNSETPESGDHLVDRSLIFQQDPSTTGLYQEQRTGLGIKARALSQNNKLTTQFRNSLLLQFLSFSH